jgi:hypothetical protein
MCYTAGYQKQWEYIEEYPFKHFVALLPKIPLQDLQGD